MKSLVGVGLAAVILATTVFVVGGSAEAAHVDLSVAPAGELTVGSPAEAQVTLLTADGALPVAGATVTLYREASFAGTTGEVEVGRATTDENGVAVLSYEPRFAGEHQMRVEYLPPDATEPEEATWSQSVAGTTHQLHQSTSGIQVPGINVWILMAVLATVWTILLSVALRVVAIARDGREVAMPESVALEDVKGTA